MLRIRHHSLLTRKAHRPKLIAMATATDQEPLEAYRSRCRGVLLWKACADTLGAALEGLQSDEVLTQFPNGVIRYAHTERPFGRYTDDTQMAISLARSLVEVGKLDAGHVSMTYAQDFEPGRGYGQTAARLLSELKAGVADWRTVARQFFPEGSFANGGAMRIAPLGLAYRHASLHVLHTAVKDALICTHVHPEAVDGAVAIAAATAWLSKQLPPDCAVQDAGLDHMIWSPVQQRFVKALLAEVQNHVQTEALKERLALLSKMLQANAPTQSPAVIPRDTNVAITDLEKTWVPYLQSPAWREETAQAWQLSSASFQIRAVDAVPMVLYAFCRHALSEQPARAILAACHYGGDADTVAAMAGALVGALYGDRFLPTPWLEELENDHPLGRDGIIRIADNLAALDVRQSSNERAGGCTIA